MALIRGTKNANKRGPVFQPYPNGVLMEGKAHRPFRNPAATPFLTPLLAKICICCPMLAQSAPSRIVRPWQGQTGRYRPARSFCRGCRHRQISKIHSIVIAACRRGPVQCGGNDSRISPECGVEGQTFSEFADASSLPVEGSCTRIAEDVAAEGRRAFARKSLDPAKQC